MSIVTVEKARQRLGLAATADHRDEEIADLIAAAEAHVEDLSHHILERREVRVPLFAHVEDNRVDLHVRPIVSVDAISYRDAQGVDQEIVGDGLSVFPTPGGAWIATGTGTWPIDYHAAGVATVTAGYDNVDAVPPKLIQAVMVLVGQWFEDPTGERPISPHVKALCWSARDAL